MKKSEVTDKHKMKKVQNNGFIVLFKEHIFKEFIEMYLILLYYTNFRVILVSTTCIHTINIAECSAPNNH